jgi:hypothetical protein
MTPPNDFHCQPRLPIPRLDASDILTNLRRAVLGDLAGLLAATANAAAGKWVSKAGPTNRWSAPWKPNGCFMAARRLPCLSRMEWLASGEKEPCELEASPKRDGKIQEGRLAEDGPIDRPATGLSGPQDPSALCPHLNSTWKILTTSVFCPQEPSVDGLEDGLLLFRQCNDARELEDLLRTPEVDLNAAELARKIRETNHLRFFTPGTWRRIVLRVKACIRSRVLWRRRWFWIAWARSWYWGRERALHTVLAFTLQVHR